MLARPAGSAVVDEAVLAAQVPQCRTEGINALLSGRLCLSAPSFVRQQQQQQLS